MRYYSTNSNSEIVDFKEATIKGQARDKGLYFPERIPVLPKEIIENLKNISKEEIALHVMQPYVGDTIPASELKNIIEETIAFDFPLVALYENIFSLELYHGPTLAFKDVGARFMSRCLRYFLKNNNKKITVLVATSGDTGGAVANGFYNVEGVDVVILYPSGKVSDLQELQLTTLCNNIHALEVNGSFDDCQRMVKAAFADDEINNHLFLTSANSINVARWLPQQLYYFFAYQQWQETEPPVISVPSGNFGNICAGLLAYCSGLPVAHFIAACNANDVVPEYFSSGSYTPKKTIHTLSNAMDVGDPSNFIRILHLFSKDKILLEKIMSCYSISDVETEGAIKEVFGDKNYLLDPHGAVGYVALKKYLKEHPGKKGFFLETAHPVKFHDSVEKIIDKKVDVPESVSRIFSKKKESLKMDAENEALKLYLIKTDN